MFHFFYSFLLSLVPPSLALECIVGEGMLSQPENFSPGECDPARPNAVCFMAFGKDLGDQIKRGCRYIDRKEWELLGRVEKAEAKGSSNTVLLSPPAPGEPGSSLGPTCKEEEREFGRRVNLCYCAREDQCNGGRPRATEAATVVGGFVVAVGVALLLQRQNLSLIR